MITTHLVKACLSGVCLIFVVSNESFAQTPAQCFSNPALCSGGGAKAEKSRVSKKSSRSGYIAEIFNGYDQGNRKYIQNKLAELGLYNSSIDGVFGSGTRKAIINYLRSKGVQNPSREEVAAAIFVLAEPPKEITLVQAGVEYKESVSKNSAEGQVNAAKTVGQRDVPDDAVGDDGVAKGSSLPREKEQTDQRNGDLTTSPGSQQKINVDSSRDIAVALKKLLQKNPQKISLEELVVIGQISELASMPWSAEVKKEFTQKYSVLTRNEALKQVLDAEIAKQKQEKLLVRERLEKDIFAIVSEITSLILLNPLEKKSLLYAEQVTNDEKRISQGELDITELTQIYEKLSEINAALIQDNKSQNEAKSDSDADAGMSAAPSGENEEAIERDTKEATDGELSLLSERFDINFKEIVRSKAFGDGIENYYAADGFMLVGVSLTLSGDERISSGELLNMLRSTFEGGYRAAINGTATKAFAAQNAKTNVFEHEEVPLGKAFEVVFEVPSQTGTLTEVALITI